MKTFVTEVITELDKTVDGEKWAELFVNRRMECFRRYSNGLITSTTPGAEYFQIVLDCLNGKEWKEEGEYGNNFRKIISLNRA